MKLCKMIEMYLKYDNMHTIEVINAFICIDNHVNSCIICMLSLVYVSIWIRRRFTMEDKKHTHDMGIYSKIRSSIWGCVNSLDKSLEDRPSIVTKVFPFISCTIPGHFCRFYQFYGGTGLGNVGGLRGSFKKIYV